MDHSDVFSIKPVYRVLRWVLLVLLLTFSVLLAVFALKSGRRGYFDLDFVWFFFLIAGFFWVAWAAHMHQQTTYMQLLDDAFVVKKVGRRPATYPYEAIVSHDERLTSDRYGAYHEFTVYMANNWFAIRSNDFRDYNYLKKELSRYGQPGPDGLQAAIRMNQPITLLIRQSEFRKKLTQTEPLTFGDKYDGYNQILVFGVRQGDWVDLQTSQPVYEPTHTRPLLRTFFLSILLVFCWTGWVYVERLEVLGER